MVWSIRRVVTGHDENGRSTVIFDDKNGQVKEMDSMPGLVLTDLWETVSSPADNSGTDDAVNRPVRLEPMTGGSIFRIVEFPPDGDWLDKVDVSTAFDSVAAGGAHDDGSSDPLRHKTDTIDYIVILEGEIDAVLDTETIRLRRGDALVQRGTVHSWSVKGDKPCVLAVTLVSATPAV